ncbi:hypothetical protein SporoP17a_13880 [Sporosarcina ureae]|nr:hypothetical protein SporoP17a_13880 [Sporosarcina ureae]
MWKLFDKIKIKSVGTVEQFLRFLVVNQTSAGDSSGMIVVIINTRIAKTIETVTPAMKSNALPPMEPAT